MELRWRNKTLNLPAGSIMGILNVTPDSFSDGGDFLDPDAALQRASLMIDQGAAFIDVGGESSRPGAALIPLETELARVIPVISALKTLLEHRKSDVLISIDTRKPAVAAAALDAGADIVNDISGLRDPQMREVCASFGVPAVLMHMRGTPTTMDWSQSSSPFTNVVEEVRNELSLLALQALKDGVPSVILDPGFGFGKSLEQNIDLIRNLDVLKSLGYPVLLGASRKSTLGKLAGVTEPADLDPASIAAHLCGLQRGADILRVHDVKGHVQAVKIWLSINQEIS